MRDTWHSKNPDESNIISLRILLWDSWCEDIYPNVPTSNTDSVTNWISNYGSCEKLVFFYEHPRVQNQNRIWVSPKIPQR